MEICRNISTQLSRPKTLKSNIKINTAAACHLLNQCNTKYNRLPQNIFIHFNIFHPIFLFLKCFMTIFFLFFD